MAASLSPSGIASIHLFKAAVLGYTNAANASLMDDSCVSGISFKSLLPLVHRKQEENQVAFLLLYRSEIKFYLNFFSFTKSLYSFISSSQPVYFMPFTTYFLTVPSG